MKLRELWRLCLVVVACNGWWFWAKYPMINHKGEEQVSPVIIVPLFATLILLVWAIMYLFIHWDEE